jgi:hypothetical protein
VAIIFLDNIHGLVHLIEAHCVRCGVRTETSYTHTHARARRKIGKYVSLSFQVNEIKWRNVKHTVLFVHLASFVMDSGECLLMDVAVVVKQTTTSLHCRM